MSIAFLSKFFKVQGSKLKQSLNEAAVSFDPEAATEAEMLVLEEQFNDLLVKLGDAQVSLDREQKEAIVARQTYDKYLEAAEKLSKRLETEPNQYVESALTEAIDYLEANKFEVEREEQEAVEAQEYFNEVKATVEVLRDKLLTAKKSIEAAKKDMEKAQLRKERASIKAENAAALAGLRDSSNAIGDATKTMLKKAEDAKAEAAAMETKASMLGAPAKKSSLLDEVLTDSPKTSGTLADRLANLKK